MIKLCCCCCCCCRRRRCCCFSSFALHALSLSLYSAHRLSWTMQLDMFTFNFGQTWHKLERERICKQYINEWNERLCSCVERGLFFASSLFIWLLLLVIHLTSGISYKSLWLFMRPHNCHTQLIDWRRRGWRKKKCLGIWVVPINIFFAANRDTHGEEREMKRLK